MTFINENMHILILVGVGLLAFIYLLHYYIHSSIDSEVSILKKKIKKLQTIAQTQQIPNFDQMKNAGIQGRNMDFPQVFKDGNVGEDNDMIYEKTEIDADSYFDPTKS